MAQIQTDENTLRTIIREEIREGVAAITGPKFDEINKKFDAIDTKFGEIDKSIRHIEDDVAEIKLRQSVTDKKLDAVIEEFKDHEARISNLESQQHKF